MAVELTASAPPPREAGRRVVVAARSQADPQEIVVAIADLAEAETTPVETFLPEGIRDMLQAVLDART